MNNNLVSIITPAYNCVSTIDLTYKSIKNQSYSEWEWIVIEDHSSDESFEFLKKIASEDCRVVLIRTDKNSGAAVARNKGIEQAKGRYIAFLDADDFWKEDKLTKQIGFMKKNHYAFTFTDYDVLYSGGKARERKIKKDLITYKNLLHRNYIGCLTVVYDSEVIGKWYMPVDCVKREDHGAWLDMTRNGLCAYRLSDSLSIYNNGSVGVSSNKRKMIKYQYNLYRRHEKFGTFKSLYYLFICIVNRIFVGW